MFRNTFYDPYKNKLHLWETINGKRLKDTIDFVHTYYVYDKNQTNGTKDIFGKSVVKRTTDDKKKMRELAQNVSCCETDISEEIKFLHSRYEKIEMDPNFDDFNICYLDIEVALENESSKPEEAKFPINLITIKFSNTGKVFTFGTHEYTGDKKLENYYYCATEKILLEEFLTVWRKQRPDIVTGWYIDGFDIPYIIARAEKLNIKKSLSPINKVVQNHKTGSYRIAGVSILDYQALYKKFTKDNRESYSLQYISMFEIEEGKLEYEGTINDIWRTDWNRFVEYNIQDTLLVEKLEKKLKYIQLCITLSYESLVPMERVFSSISVLTGWILKTLHKKNLVMPDKVHQEPEEYEGAFVYAKEGFYKNLVSFDVESLYPHLIIAYNISPETLVTNPQHAESLSWTDHCINTPSKGIWYDKTKKGILPEIVENIFNQRKKFKAKMKKAKREGDAVAEEYFNRQQYIRKIMINSMYGVLANEYFHFYNVNNAKAVTDGGRDVIRFLSDNINKYFKEFFHKNKKYFPVEDEKNRITKDVIVLVDTDSNYISLDEVYSKLNVKEDFVTWCNNFVDEFFNPFFKKLLRVHAEKYGIPSIFNFQREKIMSKMLILAKKKYVVEVLDNEGEIYKKPKLSITGIEVVRTDTPKFCRDKIKTVLEKIFETENKEEIISLMKDIKKDFKKADIDQISIPKGISDYEKYAKQDSYYKKNGINFKKGTPKQHKAAIYYNYLVKKYGLKIEMIVSGSKIKYCHVNPGNILNATTIAFIGKYPEKFESIFKIDYEMQWQKTFQNVIQRFFDVLNWGTISFQSDKLTRFFE